MNNSMLYDWVFVFNPYRDKWLAAKRENYNQLFSGGEDTVSSSSIDTLVALIKKHGSIAKIKSL